MKIASDKREIDPCSDSRLLAAAAIALLVVFPSGYLAAQVKSAANTDTGKTFALSSPQIRNGAMIPVKHTSFYGGCYGQNVSPALSWNAGPTGTKSYAVVIYERPTSGTRVGAIHWMAYNLPPSTTSLAEGAGTDSLNLLPDNARQAVVSGGRSDYNGPCPERGESRQYVFAVYALPVSSIAPATPLQDFLKTELERHNIAKASITATFGR